MGALLLTWLRRCVQKGSNLLRQLLFVDPFRDVWVASVNPLWPLAYPPFNCSSAVSIQILSFVRFLVMKGAIHPHQAPLER